MRKMTRVAGGRKLELVCVLCNESLADLERACAGLLKNTKDNNGHLDGGDAANSATVLSEANSAIPDTGTMGAAGGGPVTNLPPQCGGYMTLSDHNYKQVVATKCGHMFHQGCLRKHVHKTLMGKGGSLFCPLCTRPFAMNRLWPVIIPPTKSQRERYLQLRIMKDQNAEMVKQLKEIRMKIAEEEEHLTRIKEDSEQCLHDIQQKQKLLDSVNGPTNKELAELTKVHLKRQEILHVVTQHNADLLKLLAEESNISTATAENMISVNFNPNPDDPNSNNFTTGDTAFGARRGASGQDLASVSSSRKFSRKTKREKWDKKSKRKSRRGHHQYKSTSRSKIKFDKRYLDEGVDSENIQISLGDGAVGGSTHNSPLPKPMPSELISPNGENRSRRQNLKSGCKKVDTLSKWKIESMKELMSLPGFSELNASDSNASTAVDTDYPAPGRSNNRQNTSHKESVNIVLSRKPNMMDKHDGVSKK